MQDCPSQCLRYLWRQSSSLRIRRDDVVCSLRHELVVNRGVSLTSNGQPTNITCHLNTAVPAKLTLARSTQQLLGCALCLAVAKGPMQIVHCE